MFYAQFGAHELASRSLTSHFIYPEGKGVEMEQKMNEFNLPEAAKEQIRNYMGFTPIVMDTYNKTKDGRHVYRFDPNTSAGLMPDQIDNIKPNNILLAHMIINAAYERSISKINGDSPVKQFFRHIRNASSHNGRFHFGSGVIDSGTNELKKDAKWNQFEIKASCQGQLLFPEDQLDTLAFWDLGDLVEFFLDFENHHPEIKTP